ncbi:SLAP domain-containing protein [Clostridium oceanicum]|uniref:SLAP domain-containing protein n=1 Tax=Clostridium oceanicum TaxID=1543 RepID=A0ABN1JR59_9CLOT
MTLCSNSSDNKEKNIDVKLSLLEKDNVVMSNVQKEILEEELDELVPIKEGQINVAGIYVFDMGEEYEVKLYLRNGLAKEVNFEDVPFRIINSKGKTLAYKIFDLRKLGNIPPYAARPWKLYFDKEDDLKVDKIDSDDWKIVFDSNIKALRNIEVEYENLPEGIDESSKKVYDEFLKELPDIKEGEVSFSTFSIGVSKEGTLLVTIVIRNASKKAVNIEKLPMSVKDEKDRLVVSEVFEIDDLKVMPLKAKVCNFAFKMNVTPESNIPLDSWKIEYQVS